MATKFWQLRDRAWLEAHASMATRDAAKEIGCCAASVCRAYIEQGVPRKLYVMPRRYPLLYDKDWMEKNLHRTLRSVAKELGCSEWTVSRARRDMGLKKCPGKIDVDKLKRMAHLYSDVELAKMCGVKPRTIWIARKRHGIRGHYPVNSGRIETLLAVGYSREEVAKMLRYSVSAVNTHAPRTVRFPELSDVDWMAQHANLTDEELAKLLGCRVGRVRIAREKLVSPCFMKIARLMLDGKWRGEWCGRREKIRHDLMEMGFLAW